MVPSLPPRRSEIVVSVRLRLFMLPSPSRLRARPSEIFTFEATSTFILITARSLARPPRRRASIGFRNSVSLLSAIQATELLTFAPAGLSPAEHASLRWTQPYVTLSRHTAPIKEPPRILAQCANRCGAWRDTVLTQRLARWTRLRSFLYFCLAHLTSS
jgi:hypothetical protein